MCTKKTVRKWLREGEAERRSEVSLALSGCPVHGDLLPPVLSETLERSGELRER